MEEQKYPIGIQSFDKIIEGGFTYVDKTGFVGRLVQKDGYYFLSRPRRFGKSLLLSTLHAYFDGQRELFRGLAIDKMVLDWTPTPVLHFDFNSAEYSLEDALEKLLFDYLGRYETTYGIQRGQDERGAIPQRFRNVIEAVYQKTGRKVAILIDEYDKPLLGIEDTPEIFERNQALLKGFFGNLKTMDQYIRFAMLTGVARFNKVSIFSDVNNLNDISMDEAYGEICGWTEEELKDTFHPGIEALAEKRKENVEQTTAVLCNYYDGYLFCEEGKRLYNPFSVLRALYSRRIRPYWFDTATPTFLAKRVKASGINPEDLNGGVTKSYNDLLAVGLGTRNPVALMFQTGYLTIDSFDPDSEMYTLRFPNREVEIGFAECLYPLYLTDEQALDTPFSVSNFKMDLFNGDPEAFMQRLDTLFKSLPSDDHHESTYRAITYLLSVMSGASTDAESHSYRGRSDLEVKTTKYIYLFEFKYNRSVREAMEQIHTRGYAGRHALTNRTVYLIGANFDSRKASRGLTYEIEKVN